MMKRTIVLILLTSALANPPAPVEQCGQAEYDATETIQKFEFLPNTSSQICTCTIHTAGQRTLKVTLPIPTEQQPSGKTQFTQQQCVQVSHRDEKKTICNQQENNTYSAKGDIIIMQASSTVTGKAQGTITIEFQLVNDKECSPDPNPVTEKELSFHISQPASSDIPANLQCVWRLNTTQQQNIVVWLHVNSPTTESQCVKVSDKTKNVPKEICGKTNDNKSTSSGNDVIVQYGESSTRAALTNFQVFYRFETLEDICGILKYDAVEEAKQFKFTTKEDSEQCTWTIETNTKRTIQVSLAVPESPGQQQSTTKQCVRASDDEHEQQICTEGDHTKFTAKKFIKIKQEKIHPLRSVGQEITVLYQLVNDLQCYSKPKPATKEEQFFHISTLLEADIPAGLQCIWEVNTTEGKNIVVRLNKDSTAAEKQCVFVSDAAKRTEENICTKSDKSQFESNGQSVTIRYDGEDAKVSNFKVYYKSGAVATKISLHLLFLGFHQYFTF